MPIHDRRRSQNQVEKESPYFYYQILWGFNCLFAANYSNLIIIFITFEVMYKAQKKRPTHVDLLSFAPPLGLEPRTL